MSEYTTLELTPKTIAEYGVCGYKDVKKHAELRKKIEWYRINYPKGLRIKIILARDNSYQGMIEYMPGTLAYRPVDAREYLFIQCLFVGFNKKYKGRGFASLLISECIETATSAEMKGVAVITRKGSFMVNKEIFLKHGFEVVDKVQPDFELLVNKFDESAQDPSFRNMKQSLEKYTDGLYVLRSVQCPYTEKNVQAIIDTAKKEFNIDPHLIELKDEHDVQDSPCPFGSFCIIYNGEIISHHPISNTRFKNIMNKLVHITTKL